LQKYSNTCTRTNTCNPPFMFVVLLTWYFIGALAQPCYSSHSGCCFDTLCYPRQRLHVAGRTYDIAVHSQKYTHHYSECLITDSICAANKCDWMLSTLLLCWQAIGKALACRSKYLKEGSARYAITQCVCCNITQCIITCSKFSVSLNPHMNTQTTK
jgi:hypothetical protein